MAGKKRKKETKKRAKSARSDIKVITDIATRYLLLLLASAKGLWIFYFLFTPLTIIASSLLLGFFYPVKMYINAIMLNNEIMINMVKACIAGAAYYLLLILNLTTANIKFSRRIGIFFFDAFLFLLLNVARIFILVLMQAKDIALFDITHRIFWYGISTLYVVFVWLLTVKIFKIKDIPIYSDLRFLRAFSFKKR